MTCPHCEGYAATTRAQLNERLAKIAQGVQTGVRPCSYCNSFGWYTTEKFLPADVPAPGTGWRGWLQRWFGLPS